MTADAPAFTGFDTLAMQAGVPIVPVAITGSDPWKMSGRGWIHAPSTHGGRGV